MTILLILIIIVGVRHAFEPDHIVAVLAISTESNSLTATAKQGAIWGIGHTITLLLFSMMLLGMKIQINESVFIIFEFIVGLVLIIMGIDVIRKAKIFFSNTKNDTSTKQKYTCNEARLSLKALGVGLLHGAAGSGLIIALVTTTIDSVYLKFTYIALFSVGLIICMSLLSIFLSMPLHRRIKFIPFRRFKYLAGACAILVGMNMLYQSGLQINALLISL